MDDTMTLGQTIERDGELYSLVLSGTHEKLSGTVTRPDGVAVDVEVDVVDQDLDGALAAAVDRAQSRNA